jgi:hypothetical protein
MKRYDFAPENAAWYILKFDSFERKGGRWEREDRVGENRKLIGLTPDRHARSRSVSASILEG